AKDLPEFQTSWALSKVSGKLTAETKDRIANMVLASIAKAESEVLKDEWIRRLAQRLGLGEESLRVQLSQAKTPQAPVRRTNIAGAETKRPIVGLSPADRVMIQALFKKPNLSVDAEKIAETDFESETAQRIFAKLRDLSKDGLEGAQSSWSAAL